MDADLLLTWMSEVGSGYVGDARQRVAWAARAAADASPNPYETSRWLRDISTLAHAEIDWQGGAWAITPAVAALLPASGGTAVLAGSRRVGVIDLLEECLAVHVVRDQRNHSWPLPAPSSVFVQADSLAELRAALAEVGVQWGGCASRGISLRLREIALGAPAAPPAWGDAVEHLSARDDEVRFRSGLPPGDGLCRTTVHGRQSYRYRSNGSWYHTDHATGILLDRANRRINVFGFRADRVADGEEIGTVFVDPGVPLPPLQARALVLCSGLPTQFGDTAHTTIYRNVPQEIALLVARSVRQQVTVIA